MDRESPVYVLRIVSRATLKALAHSGKFDVRGGECLMGKEKLEDGRDLIILSKQEFARMEAIEREVDAQAEALPVTPEPVVAEAPQEIRPPAVPPKSKERLEYERLFENPPVEREHGTRPREGVGGLDMGRWPF
jgi:hypothetical protein